MNAAAGSVRPVSPVLQDSTNGNDSEPNAAGEYYRPIAGDDSSDTDSDSDELNTNVSNHSHSHSNGYTRQAEEEEDRKEDADEEEEEEVRIREASDSAIVREQENRRRAPLTRENATRVMEAMRQIPFPGMTPEWANHVPENRWIDLLRQRSSHQNSSATTATTTTTTTTTSSTSS